MCDVYTDASRDENVVGIAFISDVSEGSRYIVGEYTSMEAEFLAVNNALRRCTSEDELHIHTDCQPLVRKIANGEEYDGLYETFDWLARKYDAVAIEYVPREENRAADRKAKEAFWEGKTYIS